MARLAYPSRRGERRPCALQRKGTETHNSNVARVRENEKRFFRQAPHSLTIP